MKKTVINLLIVLLTLEFIYAFFDILFRILGIGGGVHMRPDRLLGTALIPRAAYRQSSEGFSKGKINSHGLREYEYSYEKPRNTFRILIMGDSFTEALQVPLDSAFHQTLERSLNSGNGKKNYEVVAMGMSGMGTFDELLWYRTEGRKYRPDLVICAFYLGNDFRDNSRELTRRAAASTMRPFLLENGIDTQFVASKSFRAKAALVPIMRYSRVVTYVVRSIEKIRKGSRAKSAVPEFPFDLNVFRTQYDSAWTRAVQITRRIVNAFYDEVKKDSARFIIVGIPDSYQFYRTLPNVQYSPIPNDLNFDKPDSLLENMAAASGIRYISLSPCFQSAFKRTGLFYYGWGARAGTGHWNERGHRLAAECLEEALKPFIP